MNEEMMLRYLYFLTAMVSGTPRFKPTYDAWQRFSDDYADDYPDLIDKVRAFQLKYKTRKEKS